MTEAERRQKVLQARYNVENPKRVLRKADYESIQRWKSKGEEWHKKPNVLKKYRKRDV